LLILSLSSLSSASAEASAANCAKFSADVCRKWRGIGGRARAGWGHARGGVTLLFRASSFDPPRAADCNP
jgi:hypothetical protein